MLNGEAPEVGGGRTSRWRSSGLLMKPYIGQLPRKATDDGVNEAVWGNAALRPIVLQCERARCTVYADLILVGSTGRRFAVRSSGMRV